MEEKSSRTHSLFLDQTRYLRVNQNLLEVWNTADGNKITQKKLFPPKLSCSYLSPFQNDLLILFDSKRQCYQIAIDKKIKVKPIYFATKGKLVEAFALDSSHLLACFSKSVDVLSQSEEINYIDLSKKDGKRAKKSSDEDGDQITAASLRGNLLLYSTLSTVVINSLESQNQVFKLQLSSASRIDRVAFANDGGKFFFTSSNASSKIEFWSTAKPKKPIAQFQKALGSTGALGKGIFHFYAQKQKKQLKICLLSQDQRLVYFYKTFKEIVEHDKSAPILPTLELEAAACANFYFTGNEQVLLAAHTGLGVEFQSIPLEQTKENLGQELTRATSQVQEKVPLTGLKKSSKMETATERVKIEFSHLTEALEKQKAKNEVRVGSEALFQSLKYQDEAKFLDLIESIEIEEIPAIVSSLPNDSVVQCITWLLNKVKSVNAITTTSIKWLGAIVSKKSLQLMKEADSGLLAQLGEVNYLINRKIANITSLGRTIGKLEMLSEIRKIKSKEEQKQEGLPKKDKQFVFFEVNGEEQKEEIDESGLEMEVEDNQNSDEEEEEASFDANLENELKAIEVSDQSDSEDLSEIQAAQDLKTLNEAEHQPQDQQNIQFQEFESEDTE